MWTTSGRSSSAGVRVAGSIALATGPKAAENSRTTTNIRGEAVGATRSHWDSSPKRHGERKGGRPVLRSRNAAKICPRRRLPFLGLESKTMLSRNYLIRWSSSAVALKRLALVASTAPCRPSSSASADAPDVRVGPTNRIALRRRPRLRACNGQLARSCEYHIDMLVKSWGAGHCP